MINKNVNDFPGSYLKFSGGSLQTDCADCQIRSNYSNLDELSIKHTNVFNAVFCLGL